MVNYPKDWETVRLGDIISYIQPQMYIENDFSLHGKIPVLTAGKSFILGYSNNVDKSYGDVPAILFDDFTTEVRYLNYPFMVKSSATKFLKEKSSKNCLKFIFYWLNNLNYCVEAHERHWISKFSKFTITVPPFSEQQAIADALTAFDTHINNLAKLIEKKKMIRDGAVEDLVSGKRRLAGFSGKWESKSLLDIAIILNGLTYKPEDVRPYGKLVIRSSNIKDGKLVYIDNVYVDEAKSTSEDVAIGDVIICVRNGSSALIGKSAYVQENIDATVGAFMSNIRCHNTHLSKFFYYFTKTETFKDFINEVLGATINQITKSDLKRLKFAIPLSLYEQQAIADILTAMDKEISDLEEEKEKYIALKAGAMDDLLTGKIRLV